MSYTEDMHAAGLCPSGCPICAGTQPDPLLAEMIVQIAKAKRKQGDLEEAIRADERARCAAVATERAEFWETEERTTTTDQWRERARLLACHYRDFAAKILERNGGKRDG